MKKADKKVPKLVRGQKARTAKGYKENVKREEALGKSKQRAYGTAYGEAYLAIDEAARKLADAKKRMKKHEAEMRKMEKKLKAKEPYEKKMVKRMMKKKK
jgi:hypothetical protein